MMIILMILIILMMMMAKMMVMNITLVSIFSLGEKRVSFQRGGWVDLTKIKHVSSFATFPIGIS